MVITPEERARAVVRAVLSAYFDGASFRNVPPRCIAALSRFDLEYGNKKRREVEDLTVAGQGAHPMTAPEKVIGFEEDCDHVLCERCCKDGRMCCEKEWRVCEDCDGGTVYYDSDDDDERSYGRECRPAPCETCDGAGGWWFCSCDENGNHARKQP